MNPLLEIINITYHMFRTKEITWDFARFILTSLGLDEDTLHLWVES